jgi:hypothetical protein
VKRDLCLKDTNKDKVNPILFSIGHRYQISSISGRYCRSWKYVMVGEQTDRHRDVHFTHFV